MDLVVFGDRKLNLGEARSTGSALAARKWGGKNIHGKALNGIGLGGPAASQS